MTQVLILEPEAALYGAALAALVPGTRVLPVTNEAEALRHCAEAEVLIAFAQQISARLIGAMPRLRWIQALTTGVDPLAALALPPSVVVTSARGVHGPQMSELALLYMLALPRRFRAMAENQAGARWERWPQPLLLGKTAVLLGVGLISEALAARCRAFGMRVIGVSSSRSSAPGFDSVVGRERLHEAAAEADFLVALVPYTPQTHRIADAALFAAMRPDAFFINLARGGVVDQAALIAALQDGRIAGAGLDVFEVEPLPAESPLWAMPNVIVTPHIGGMSDGYRDQVVPLIAGNLQAFNAGARDRMRNVVRL